MSHSECQLMTKPNIIAYVKLSLFKVGSINYFFNMTQSIFYTTPKLRSL